MSLSTRLLSRLARIVGERDEAQASNDRLFRENQQLILLNVTLRRRIASFITAVNGSWDAEGDVEGQIAEALLRIQQLKLDARPRCSCDGDPIDHCGVTDLLIQDGAEVLEGGGSNG